MKNIITDSDLSNNSGSIRVGDVTIVLGNYDGYNKIISSIQALEKKQYSLKEELESKKKLLVENHNEFLEELIVRIEAELIEKNEDYLKFQKDLETFIDYITSAINYCLKEKDSIPRIEFLQGLIEAGQINLVNSELNLDNIIGRRNELKDLQSRTDNELKNISKELALKAKTVLLQKDDEHRNDKCYRSYKESIATFDNIDVRLDFAKFLMNYNLEEAISMYEYIIKNNRQTISQLKLANILYLASNARLHNYNYDLALDHLDESISLLEYIITTEDSEEVKSAIIKDYEEKITILIGRYGHEEIKDLFRKINTIIETLDSNSSVHKKSKMRYLNMYVNYAMSVGSPGIKYEALKVSNELLKEFGSINNNRDKLDLAVAHNITGGVALRLGEEYYENSLNNLLIARQYIEEFSQEEHIPTQVSIQNFTFLSQLYNRTGKLNKNSSDVDKSIFYLREAINVCNIVIKLRKRMGETVIANVYNELGSLEGNKGNIIEYWKCKTKSISYYKELVKNSPGDIQISTFYSFRGLIPNFTEAKVLEVEDKPAIFQYIDDVRFFLESLLKTYRNDPMLSTLLADLDIMDAIAHLRLNDNIEYALNITVKAINLIGLNIRDEYHDSIIQTAISILKQNGVSRITYRGKIINV